MSAATLAARDAAGEDVDDQVVAEAARGGGERAVAVSESVVTLALTAGVRP